MVRDEQIFFQKLLLDMLVQPLRVEAELKSSLLFTYTHKLGDLKLYIYSGAEQLLFSPDSKWNSKINMLSLQF